LADSTVKTILYVEDDVDIQTIGKMTLETFGNYKVFTSNNGKEALDTIEKVMPDLVLMDVMMPEMDGITAMQEFKKNPEVNKIPVIFMTAKAQVHEVEKYIEIGVAGVITKPFEPINLCSTICEILEKYHARQNF